MHERIKQLRKQLKINQSEFGSRIGISRDTIANIEGNRIEIKDIYVLSICKEFNVNEDWLRTGDGEMFNQSDEDEELAAIVGRVLAGEDEFRKALYRQIGTCDQKYIDMLKEFVENIYKDMNR